MYLSSETWFGIYVNSCTRCHWQLPSVWWRGCQSRSQPPTSSSPSIWSASAFSWGSLSPSYTWRIGNEDFFVTPKVKHVCIPRALPWLPCPSLGPPSRQELGPISRIWSEEGLKHPLTLSTTSSLFSDGDNVTSFVKRDACPGLV